MATAQQQADREQYTRKLTLIHSDESLDALCNSGHLHADELYESDQPIDTLQFMKMNVPDLE